MNYIPWLRKRVGHVPVILVVVVAIVENRVGSVLAVRKIGSESWGLPGGFIEPGETATQTLFREVKEETGLTIKVVRPLGVYTNYPLQRYPNGDRAYVVHIAFVCKVVRGRPKPDGKEVEELNWLQRRELCARMPRHKHLLKDYCESKDMHIR